MENAVALPKNATQQPPQMHLRQQNPNSGEKAICRVSVSNRVVNGSKLVKFGQMFKSGQRLVKR